jgi:hypothetical protein
MWSCFTHFFRCCRKERDSLYISVKHRKLNSSRAGKGPNPNVLSDNGLREKVYGIKHLIRLTLTYYRTTVYGKRVLVESIGVYVLHT